MIIIMDPMPPRSLADVSAPRGLWCPALAARAARAARPSAAALIGSFSTRVMRRWGRSRRVRGSLPDEGVQQDSWKL